MHTQPLSRVRLCDPMDYSPPGSSVHGDSPGKNTGVACHFFLQGIFPTLGSNPGLLWLLHCTWFLSFFFFFAGGFFTPAPLGNILLLSESGSVPTLQWFWITKCVFIMTNDNEHSSWCPFFSNVSVHKLTQFLLGYFPFNISFLRLHPICQDSFPLTWHIWSQWKASVIWLIAYIHHIYVCNFLMSYKHIMRLCVLLCVSMC